MHFVMILKRKRSLALCIGVKMQEGKKTSSYFMVCKLDGYDLRKETGETVVNWSDEYIAPTLEFALEYFNATDVF